jgi:hypothetical protein
MADGFYVNPDHLGFFEQQVRRNLDYVQRAVRTMPLWEMKAALQQPAGASGSALAHIGLHLAKWIDRADDDTEKVAKALSTSADSLKYSARYYRELDDAKEAELDRLYDPGNNYIKGVTSGEPIQPGANHNVSLTGPPVIRGQDVKGWSSDATPADYTQKDYHWIDLHPLKELDPKTNGSSVFYDNWLLDTKETGDAIKELIPSVAILKEALSAVFGTDVIARISEFVAGDWLAVEKIARGLHWHGVVQHDVHDNLTRGLYAMQGMWTGAAGGQMQDTMQHLVNAGIAPHANFLWEARDRVLAYAKVTYHSFKTVQRFLDILIDALEVKVLVKAGLKKAVDFVNSLGGTLKAGWNAVMKAIADVETAAHVAGAVIAAASALSGSAGSTGGLPPAFYHPADVDQDGKLTAGEKEGRP